MSNMAYCRFRNTLADLKDCYKYMQDNDSLPLAEYDAFTDMVDLCKKIVEEYSNA